MREKEGMGRETDREIEREKGRQREEKEREKGRLREERKKERKGD